MQDQAEVTALRPDTESGPENIEEAIVVRSDVVGPPGPAEWRAMREQAMTICTTEFVPKEMRGSPEKVMAAILTGRELGLGPMAAMQGIRIQDGKPAYDAELMRALVRRRGHDIEAIVKTHTECVVWGRRRDTGREAWVRWDLKDALIANLIDSIKGDGLPQARSKNGYPMPWEQYPRRMLFARATGELVADLFADVLVGSSYTPEEIGAVSDWNEPEDPEAQARRLETARLVGMIDQAIEDGTLTAAKAQSAALSHGLRTRSEVRDAPADVLRSLIDTLGIDTVAPSGSSQGGQEPPEVPAEPEPAPVAPERDLDTLAGRVAASVDMEWTPGPEDESGDAASERMMLIRDAAEVIAALDLSEAETRKLLNLKAKTDIAAEVGAAWLVVLRVWVDLLEAEQGRRAEQG